MSGKRLAFIVVVSFVLLAAGGYWLTGLEEPSPQPEPSTAPQLPLEVPSSRSQLGGPPGSKTGATPRVGEPIAFSTARPAPSPPEPSRTPVTDGLTQALLDARPGPIALPAPPQEHSGSVDKEEVRAAIKAVTPLVRQCFEDVAKRYPGPQKVKLTFTIQGQGLSGYLKDGEVDDSTIPDPFLQTCFLEAMADAKFPPPHGGATVRVTYPFSYGAGEDAR